MATPFSYPEVKRSYEEFGSKQGFSSMPEYVRYLAEGSPDTAAQFSAGGEDSTLRNIDYWFQEAIDGTDVPKIGGVLGRSAGELLGAPAAGQRGGEALARGTVNLLPLLLTGGGTLPVQLAGALGTGGLSALDVYGKGASGAAALTTGALSAALPWFTNKGAQLGLATVGAPSVEGIATNLTSQLIGKEAGSVVSQRVAETLGQRVASYVGGQTAAFVPFGAKDYVEAKLRGVENPLATRDYWVESLIGQLPFSVTDVPSLVAKGPSAKLVQATLKKEAPTAVPPKPPKTPDAVQQPTPPDPITVQKTTIILDTMKKKAAVASTGLDEAGMKKAYEQIDKQQSEALASLGKGPERNGTQLGTTFGTARDTVTLRGTVRGETPPNPAREGHEGSVFLNVEGSDALGYVGKVVGLPKKVLTMNADGSYTIPKKYLFMSGQPIVKPTERTQPLKPTDKPLVGPVKGVDPRAEVALDAFGNPDWSVDADGGVEAAIRAMDPVDETAGVEAIPTPQQVQEALARKVAQDELTIASLDKLSREVPDNDPATLEEAKAQLVVVDKVNGAMENGKTPVSDAELHKEIETELKKTKAELSEVTSKVVRKKKAQAKEKVDDEVAKTKREQKALERQVRGALVHGEVAQKAKAVKKAQMEHADIVTQAKQEGKEVPPEPTIDPAAVRDAEEISLLDEIMRQYEGHTDGRMLQFVDELKVAYADWRNNTDVQGKLEARAKGDEKKLTSLRRASLLELAKTVRLRHSTGQVITGGKVLRKGNKWSPAGEKGQRETFATREEAEAKLDEMIESDEDFGVDFKVVKVMSSKDRKGVDHFYLQERPRTMNVEFVPGEVTTDTIRTQVEAEADVTSDAFAEVEAERRADMLSKSKETVEGLRELGEAGTHVVDAIREITLGLTEKDAAKAYKDSGETFTPDDLTHAATRLAILNEGQADGSLPVGEWNDHNLAEFQARLIEKGAHFDTLPALKDFLDSTAVRLLRLEVGRRLRASAGFEDAMAREVGIDTPMGRMLVPEGFKEKVEQLGLDQPNPIKSLEKIRDEGDSLGALAEGLLQYRDVLEQVGLTLDPSNRHSGVYDSSTNGIRVGYDYAATESMYGLQTAMTHEAAHAISVHLINRLPNHPAVRELNRLREEYIKALPGHLQNAIQRAIRENLISQYQRTGRIPDFGVRDDAELQLLYAAIDTKEFVAQTFSREVVRTVLSRTLIRKEKSLYQWFAHWIGKLVGSKVPKESEFSSLLEQTLLATNRVFESDKTLMHFENLAKRVFVDETGLTGPPLFYRLQNHWQMLSGLNRTFKDHVIDITENFLGSARDGALSQVENAWLKKGFNKLAEWDMAQRQEFGQMLKEFGLMSKEHAEHDVVYALGSLWDQPSKLQDFLQSAPAGTESIARGMLEFALVDTKALIAQEQAADKGLVNLRPVGDVKLLKEHLATFEKAFDIVDGVIADNFQVQNLAATMSPTGFAQVAKDLSEGPISAQLPSVPRPVQEVIDMPETHKTISGFWKTVGPAWQIAMEHPAMKPVIALAFNFKGEVGRALHRAFSHFATKVSPDGVADWNPDTMKRAESFFGRADLVARADKILLLRQTKKGFLSSHDPVDKKGLDDALSGLSQNERELTLEMADHQSRSMQELQEIVVEEETNMGEVALASVFHHGSTNDVEVSRTMSQDMLRAVTAMQDPTQAPMAMQQLTALQTQMTPEKFLRGIQFAQNEVARIAEFKKFFGAREWFATEQRFDKWRIRARLSDGRASFVDGPTREAALKRLQQQDGNAVVIDVIKPEKEGESNRLYGVSEKLLAKLEELEQSQLNALRAAGIDEAQLATRKENSLVETLKIELAANQLYKPGSKRAGVAGREFLPMLANHFNYGTALVNSLMKRKTRAEALFRSTNPDLVAAPEQAKLALEHIENFLAPDSEWATKTSHGVATYNLAFNLANHMAEASQSMLTHTTQLTAEGAGVVGGYRRVLKATKDIASWVKNGGKWKNAEHEKLMQQATLDKEIGFGVWDDSLADSDAVLHSFRELITGKTPTGVKGVVKSAAQGYAKLGSNLYGVFTHFNARVALLSSFDFYRSKGMDFDAAYEKAREFNRTVNFSGGRAARPVGLYKTRGQWRSASQFLGLMRSYSLGMWATLARNAKTGFGKSSNLSYAERVNGRKATVQMLATMFAMGGALGLPGVEAAVAAIEQLTDLKLKESLRTGVQEALGDPTLGEGFLMGLPNMMGVDAHSRVSLGGFPGVSSFTGFSLTDLLGPAYGLFERMAVGAKKSISDNVVEGSAYVLPPGFRRLAEIVKGGGDITNNRGDLLARSTTGEKIALAVGFDPTRIANLKESERIRRRSQQIDNDETNAFNVDVATVLASGDIPAAKAKVKERLATKKDVDLKSVVRGIQDAVERKTFPAELLDKPGNVSALAAAYGMQNIPNEVARLQLRDHVAQLLGLPKVVDPKAVQQAALVDSLLSQRPELSRRAARNLAESF